MNYFSSLWTIPFIDLLYILFTFFFSNALHTFIIKFFSSLYWTRGCTYLNWSLSLRLPPRFHRLIKEMVAKRWQSVTLVRASDAEQPEARLLQDLFPPHLHPYLAHVKDAGKHSQINRLARHHGSFYCSVCPHQYCDQHGGGPNCMEKARRKRRGGCARERGHGTKQYPGENPRVLPDVRHREQGLYLPAWHAGEDAAVTGLWKLCNDWLLLHQSNWNKRNVTVYVSLDYI